MKYLSKFNENEEWQKDENDFFFFLEIIGCDYNIGFSFGNVDVPPSDIKDCIEHYNKLDRSWIGGPVSDGFINWFSYKYGKPISRKSFHPIIKLTLQLGVFEDADTSGEIVLGFGVKSKKISTMNCKDIYTSCLHKKQVIDDWIKHHIFDKRLSFDETIKLLNIKTDFNW